MIVNYEVNRAKFKLTEEPDGNVSIRGKNEIGRQETFITNPEHLEALIADIEKDIAPRLAQLTDFRAMLSDVKALKGEK